MNVVVAGGGPVGIFCAMALARRGHVVALVDRDPGPPSTGEWKRTGVMQFLHPHAYRAQVRWALEAELPDVYATLLAAGVEVRLRPGMPEQLAGLFGRRSTVERVLRRAAMDEPRLTWVRGHADGLITRSSGVQGVLVDGTAIPADLVIVATGRAGHLGDDLRPPAESGTCGFGYISRLYRARERQTGCGLPGPSLTHEPGYVTLAMPHDAGTHSLLFAYPVRTDGFARLRTNDGFDRAVAAVPNLAPWADPERFEPLTDVLVGGNLTNTYRRQSRTSGVVFVGDAVATMNPAWGRYLALSYGHVQALLAAVDVGAEDLGTVMQDWADEHIRPWYLEHAREDENLLRRSAGEPLDLDGPIPSDVIISAAEADPSLMPYVGPFLAMVAKPDVLDSVQEKVRGMLRAGWRPETTGPSATDLVSAAI